MTVQDGRDKPALVADQVFSVLADAIFTGELAGGSRLRVRDIASVVGTSVMPVRDALRRLEENGLVTTSPHKGARVREFTVAELLNIYEVRKILEVEATRKGAVRATEADLEIMSLACERMHVAVQRGRVSDALDEDEVLLRQLYRAGGNSVLTGTIETLWAQCRPYKVIGARLAIERGDNWLWTPQAALVAAVRARDVQLAVSITDDSVSSALRRLENKLHSTARLDSTARKAP